MTLYYFFSIQELAGMHVEELSDNIPPSPALSDNEPSSSGEYTMIIMFGSKFIFCAYFVDGLTVEKLKQEAGIDDSQLTTVIKKTSTK